jgi:hypothetical protein
MGMVGDKGRGWRAVWRLARAAAPLLFVAVFARCGADGEVGSEGGESASSSVGDPDGAESSVLGQVSEALQVCTPNATIGCNGKSAIRCNAAGTGTIATACGIGCSNGTCLACTPNATLGCNGNSVVRCNAAGTGTFLSACATGRFCSAGACIALR